MCCLGRGRRVPGYGLFAAQKIKSGTKITRYWGRQIHKQSALVWRRRNKATHIIGPKEYPFKIDGKIDAAGGFTAAWYAQHHAVASLANTHPSFRREHNNCKLVWVSEKYPSEMYAGATPMTEQIYLVAKQDIKEGQELLTFYDADLNNCIAAEIAALDEDSD